MGGGEGQPAALFFPPSSLFPAGMLDPSGVVKKGPGTHLFCRNQWEYFPIQRRAAPRAHSDPMRQAGAISLLTALLECDNRPPQRTDDVGVRFCFCFVAISYLF